MNGVLVLDKPQGFTSFDVIAVVRKLCGQRKIGHTGTLDPMATGVLPLLLGCATRAQDLLPDTDKEYQASFQLGVRTDTQDSSGKVLQQMPAHVPPEKVEQALAGLRGDILQVPPMYSAVQQNGVRLYELARRGIEVERQARPVTVYELQLTQYDPSSGAGGLRVRCSKGTYVRTLCADLGEILGCGCMMTALRRTVACGFSLEQSLTIEQLKQMPPQQIEGRLLDVQLLFSRYPAVCVSAAQAKRFANGGALAYGRLKLAAGPQDGARYRVLDENRRFVGLGQVASAGEPELRVLRLFLPAAQ
ncbi:MAG TPA: tRNA pseudouridine(55) synthase TruB [Candidatus Gallacutalibacter stercoravium]|nr:tRNA pseudouridine(55) synthase TruB [Candidatus Gallacutalibacter stercoravium]